MKNKTKKEIAKIKKQMRTFKKMKELINNYHEKDLEMIDLIPKGYSGFTDPFTNIEYIRLPHYELVCKIYRKRISLKNELINNILRLIGK